MPKLIGDSEATLAKEEAAPEAAGQAFKDKYEAHNLSKVKAAVGPLVLEMGSHLLTKQFWLFPCEGRIAQQAEKLTVCLRFYMEAMFTGSNIFIEYNSRHPMDGRNP